MNPLETNQAETRAPLVAGSGISSGPSRDAIAARAFSLFQDSGGAHGHCDANWQEAERQLSAPDRATRDQHRMQGEGGPTPPRKDAMPGTPEPAEDHRRQVGASAPGEPSPAKPGAPPELVPVQPGTYVPAPGSGEGSPSSAPNATPSNPQREVAPMGPGRPAAEPMQGDRRQDSTRAPMHQAAPRPQQPRMQGQGGTTGAIRTEPFTGSGIGRTGGQPSAQDLMLDSVEGRLQDRK